MTEEELQELLDEAKKEVAKPGMRDEARLLLTNNMIQLRILKTLLSIDATLDDINRTGVYTSAR